MTAGWMNVNPTDSLCSGALFLLRLLRLLRETIKYEAVRIFLHLFYRMKKGTHFASLQRIELVSSSQNAVYEKGQNSCKRISKKAKVVSCPPPLN
jgi:hypothetical protein